MGHTCHVWIEDEDRSGAETGLTTITDQLIENNGDTLKLRAGLNHIALMYFWTEFAAYPLLNARINAASFPTKNLRLRKGVALNYTSPDQIYDFRDNPLYMVPGEVLTGYSVETDEAGVAHFNAIVIVTTDTKIPKSPTPALTHPNIIATATSATAKVWQTLTMTLQDELGAGIYEMYGAKVIGATVVAARFIFPGLWTRPAVIPQTRTQDATHPFSTFWGGAVQFAYPGNLPKLELVETSGSGTIQIELMLRKIKVGLM